MSYELMFQKAVLLHQNGALNEAESLYRQILETAPDNADILNLLGLIAQAKGLHGEAVNYFYKAAESAPQHFPIFFNLAVSLAALNKPLEALEAYQKVLTLKPDVKEAYAGMAAVYWQQEKLTEARQAYAKVLEMDAKDTDTAVNLAELNDDTDTLQTYAAVANIRALYYLGRRAMAAENFTAAYKYLNHADSLAALPEVKFLLGQVLSAQQRSQEALKIFYQAWQLNPHQAQTAVYIADIEAEQGNDTEAEKFYVKAIELDASNVQAHANYANLLCRRKRTLEALEQYRHAVVISPQTPELSYNLAVILKTLEEYEQALSLMFNAYYLAPEHLEWSLSLAETLILYEAKEPQKARKIAQNWVERMPNDIAAQHIVAVFAGKTDAHEKEYNRMLFDAFAGNYEQTLQNINYQVVEKIAQIGVDLSGNILDLGCGTGLVAEKLKRDNNRFTGVDISAKMLENARSKNIYAQLVCEDIQTYLQNNHPDFKWVIAADVFCYFGELRKIIEQCAPSGLIFSVESADDIENWQVQPNGRYKHQPKYIEKMLREIGYNKIRKQQIILRQENGKDVDGCLFIAEV